jgi:hypothetical protein
MNKFEERLASALRNKAQEAPRAGGLEQAARARYRHRRRQTLIASTVAVAVTVIATPVGIMLVNERDAMTGPAASPGDGNSPLPSGGDATAAPSGDVEDDAGPTPASLTRCADVPRNEPPQDHGADTVFDPETNLIGIWYTVDGKNRHHTVDYVNDETCADHPLLRRLISDVVATATENDPTTPPPPSWESDFLPGENCRDYRPRELPDGTPAGSGREYATDNPAVAARAWGQDRNLVVVLRGREAVNYAAGSARGDQFINPSLPGPVVSGQKRDVVWVGEPTDGTVQIRFVQERCPYIVFLNATPRNDRDRRYNGFTPEEVEDYATRL